MSKRKSLAVEVGQCRDGRWLADIIIPICGLRSGFFEFGDTPQDAVAFLKRRVMALPMPEKKLKSINWNYATPA